MKKIHDRSRNAVFENQEPNIEISENPDFKF